MRVRSFPHHCRRFLAPASGGRCTQPQAYILNLQMPSRGRSASASLRPYLQCYLAELAETTSVRS